MREPGRSSGASAGSTDKRALRSREAITEATIRLVSRGTSDVSMTDVAAEARVSRRAIYLNYETRDNLLLQTVIALLRTEFPADEFGTSGNGRRSVDVSGELNRLADHMMANRDFYAAVLVGPSIHLVREHIVSAFSGDVRLMIRADGDVDDQTVRFAMHGIFGVLTEALLSPDPEAPRAAVPLLATLLIRLGV